MASTTLFIKTIVFVITAKYSLCTIAGLTYRDPLKTKPKEEPGSNPCNPLYWYPQHIPDHCYETTPGLLPRPETTTPQPIPIPVPVPVPVPLPVAPIPVPLPFPPVPAMPFGAPMPFPPMFPPLMAPAPFQPPIPSPYGAPFPHPGSMFPVEGPLPPSPIPGSLPPNPIIPGPPAPYFPPILPPVNSYDQNPYRRQAGIVPNIPGIVSSDGGINILPFTDIFSDMVEKQKNKMIKKRIRKIFSDYDDYPWSRRFRKRRIHKKIYSDSDE